MLTDSVYPPVTLVQGRHRHLPPQHKARLAPIAPGGAEEAGEVEPRLRTTNPLGSDAQQAPGIFLAPACRALGVPRASFYRRQRPAPGHQQPRPTPARALRASERAHVLDVLASPRFVDRSPAEVVATLLDEGRYLCASRCTGGREPAGARAAQSAQSSLLHQARAGGRPGPGTTRLRGPKSWTSFYLYVLLDIFSRYVVGWMVADRENAALAATLIEETCLKQGIEPQVLSHRSGVITGQSDPNSTFSFNSELA